MKLVRVMKVNNDEYYEEPEPLIFEDTEEIIIFAIDDPNSFCAIEGDLPVDCSILSDIYRWAKDFNDEKHLRLYRASLAGNFSGLATGLGYSDSVEYCDICLELFWLSNFYFKRACYEQN